MYHPESFSCEVCDRDYTVNNGWFVVQFKNGSLIITKMDLKLAKSNPAVCGEACLHKYISQNLERLHGERSKEGVNNS